MKEYIMIIDPFTMDQQVFETIDNTLKLVATFQLTKIESYVPLLTLFHQTENEEITINLKCPKAFRDKVKETIYTYANKTNFAENKIIIKDI